MNYLGIEKEKLGKVVESLNLLLADYQIYYQNLRNYHWNIEGENFFDLHQRFEVLYNDAKVKIDEIAERVLTLRHRPLGKISVYLDSSQISEGEAPVSDREMVNAILANHANLIDRMRLVIKEASQVGDEGTIDMIGGFLANVEKQSWMLDSWRSKTFALETSIY
ncbi:MAG: DNA starvation/stationary phase protection protein [Saprospiraceae bacterium]|nr:DNA starvation/stationary phase protection protein [Saprospiraceae bacterium]